MSYRLIDANALNGVISNDDYEKVLNAPCIFVDLPNGLDGEHYNLQEPTDNDVVLTYDMYHDLIADRAEKLEQELILDKIRSEDKE